MRAQELWRTHCQQLSEYDAIISVKDAELDRLRARTEAEELDSHPPSPSDVVAHTTPIGSEPRPHVAPARRGKAPPVDSFRGEDADVHFEDWLPTLQRAATWNKLSEEELLMQLAGHMRGRVLQEWELLDESDKSTFAKATKSLQSRLDPGSRALAAQDFRHTIQGEAELVADFI